MALKKNFYAVRNGRAPGIYTNWDDCKQQVEGFARAQYKGFATRSEAEAFMRGELAATIGGRKSSSERDKGSGAQINMPAPGSKMVVIYADGACTGNPGPGGYGVVLLKAGERQEFSGGFRRTTNNRMEILGCLVGLRALPDPSDVILISDSRYVVNAIEQSWAVNWRKRGWMRRVDNGELAPAANADLWAEMLELCEFHRVRFEWVRGHTGNVENERCDVLARTAAAARDLPADTGYETSVR